MDDELNELISVAELSKPYTSISSITPRPQVLLLPTVRSPTDKLLTWEGLASLEEGDGELYMEGSLCQQLLPISIPKHSRPFN